MKKFLILSAAFLLSIGAYAQSEKVIVDARGNVVGRYVRTNKNTYTVFGQDDFEVPKAGHRIVTYSAEAGQGYVWCKNPGAVNVRSTPSTSGNIVGKLINVEGDLPESYRCLGKQNGWYKVKVGSKIGYVRQDLVEWNPYAI